MGVNDISFPNLSIYLKNVGKTINVFGFPIAYYGIIMGCSILLGFILGAREAKKRGLNPDLVWDFSVPAIFFSIVGARIYYVATSWSKYKDHPLSVFNLREGGIGIYGAIIAAFITLYIYCRKKKIGFFVFSDTVIMGLLLGQIIGRWGNFFNREVFGGYTDNILAMRLPIDAVRGGDISTELASHIIDGTNYIQVHPTFLYEGMWNLGILLFFLWFRKHKKFEGELFFSYLMLYGIGRFWIEWIRTDQLYIPGTHIPISMVVAASSACVSLIAIMVMRKKCPQAQYVVGDYKEPQKTQQDIEK